MSTRATSREAYEHMIATGALKGQQAEVMAVIVKQSKPATSGEILYAMNVENVNAWRARFTELQNRGLIVEAGTRVCSVSKRRGVVWEATTRDKPLVPKRKEKIDGKAWRAFAKQLWMHSAAVAHTDGDSEEFLETFGDMARKLGLELPED